MPLVAARIPSVTRALAREDREYIDLARYNRPGLRLIESFEAAADWSADQAAPAAIANISADEGIALDATGDTTSTTFDPLTYREGTQAVQFTPHDVQWTKFTRALTQSLILPQGDWLASVYFKQSTRDNNTKQIRFLTDATGDNFIQYSLQINRCNWAQWSFGPRSCTLGGTATFTSPITHLQLYLQPGTNPVILDSLWLSGKGQPFVVLTLDDGHGTIFTEFYPLLKRYGLLATVFLITGELQAPGQVGNTTYLTLRQAQALRSAGWLMAVHTDTSGHHGGDGFQALTEAQTETAIQACRTQMDGWGMPEGRWYLSWPVDRYNGNNLAGAEDQGIRLARTGDTQQQKTLPFPQALYWQVDGQLTSGTTLATLKGYVDANVARGMPTFFIGHQILSTGAGANQYNRGDALELIRYCVEAHNLPFLTVAQLWELTQHAIRVPRPRRGMV